MVKEKEQRRKRSIEPRVGKEEYYLRREKLMQEQQALKREIQPTLELEYPVEGDRPLLVLLVGDLHIGHDSVDYSELEKLKDFLLNDKTIKVMVNDEEVEISTDNVKILFLGDEVEGVKSKYLTTNITGLTMDQQEQLNYFRDRILRPLAEAGKVIGMVTHYWGHPGWAHESSTIDPWAIVADACNVDTILNGGRVKFIFEDGQESVLETRHNPTAVSKHDALHGAREELLKKSEPIRPQGSAAAHIHRLAVGKEHHAGANYPFYLASSGTIKSINEDLPVDQFSVRLGIPYTAGKGFTSVMLNPPSGRYRRRSKEVIHTPMPSLRHAAVAQVGLELLNATERQGLTSELKEMVLDRFGKEPKIEWVAEESREATAVMENVPGGKALKKLQKNGFKESDIAREKVYSSLRFNIETELPILLQYMANVRIGSDKQTEGFAAADAFQRDYVINNPHAVILYLRNLLDDSAGNLPDKKRRKALEKVAGFVGRSGDKGLALLLDSNLRNDVWKRGEDPIAPGSYVARAANVPLMHHLSKVNLFVGPQNTEQSYSVAVLDKLGKHGSFSKPTFGLRRNYDLYMHQKPGIVAGGHMPDAGSQMFYDGTNQETEYPILMHPGWWGKSVDTAGKGNVSPGAPAGQGTILFPQEKKGDYLAYPTLNIEESRIFFDAFLMLVGLQKMGLVENVTEKKQ